MGCYDPGTHLDAPAEGHVAHLQGQEGSTHEVRFVNVVVSLTPPATVVEWALALVRRMLATH